MPTSSSNFVPNKHGGHIVLPRANVLEVCFRKNTKNLKTNK